ncbi:hypothetical protein Tco_0610958 [Tanacetum coccineum]
MDVLKTSDVDSESAKVVPKEKAEGKKCSFDVKCRPDVKYVMDIQEKDKNRSQIDKTEHENGKSVKEKSKLKPSQKVKVNKVKSKSTPGSGFGKSIENRTRKPKLPKVGPPVPT